MIQSYYIIVLYITASHHDDKIIPISESHYNYLRQLGNLAKHSWGTAGAQLRHSWGTKLKTLGHSRGTAGAQLGHKVTWGIVGAQLRQN